MKQWWYSRSPQDRMAMTLGAIAVVLLLVYLFLWLPFSKQISAKRSLVETQLATLKWMQNSAVEIRALRRASTHSTLVRSDEALLTLVDRTAKQNQLRQFIQRLKPQDQDAVELWLEEAPFDSLIQWLGLLGRQYDILPSAISIEAEQTSGLVDARLTLQREES